ncbi:hypothetical protein COU39_01110 [Candidatus Micrarchaeota archaeon CG10_big_fil_rev_8_21_14_0_10_60_32]|nr:MAG: hypothetical protein COU39_01110 [Candidatus Micrarchaeota archaeon CG10_big_fil_rev_8_21_14_0_10_60_32]
MNGGIYQLFIHRNSNLNDCVFTVFAFFFTTQADTCLISCNFFLPLNKHFLIFIAYYKGNMTKITLETEISAIALCLIFKKSC